MNDLHPLVRRASKDLHRNISATGIKTRVRSGGRKRAQLRQPISPTECLEILFKHLICGCLAVGKDVLGVGIFLELAVLQRKAWNDFGAVVTPMTCKARDMGFATEVISVDSIH